ncbi:anti-repressor SinI family protein [Microbacteriaceae bacterium 4G12]
MNQSNAATKDTRVLDDEWIALIMEAKEIGLSCSDIRAFLESASNKETT